MSPTLTDLARQFGCDKYYSHGYLPHYEALLGSRQVKRLLEIGIGHEGLMKDFTPFYIHGASLKMWSAYWPAAEIWACDIREDTLVNEGNIRSVQCDQSSGASLAEMVWRVTDGLSNKLDFICDDGSHVPDHQDLTCSVLLPRLAKGGLYVVEDCYEDKGSELAVKYGGRLIPGYKRADDNLVIFER